MHADIAARAYHRHGYVCSARLVGSDKKIEGDTYSIGNVCHVVTSDGGVFAERSDWRYVRVSDPVALSDIAAKIVADQETAQARDAYVAEIAGGDALLREVVRRHLDFTGGVVVEPYERESGIRFYQVGRNVSHDFFIGTKDGKCYVLSCGEVGWDWTLDIPICDEDVYEVKDWSECYLARSERSHKAS